jgi:LAO/AO transport system kinase
VVILVPGMGDELQAFKAGLMEIADLFVINKADLEGAEKLKVELEGVLSLSTKQKELPIFMTVASTGDGLAELQEAIGQRLSAFSGEERKRTRKEYVADRLSTIFSLRVTEMVQKTILNPGEWDTLLERLSRREVDPYSVVEAILTRIRGDAHFEA